MGEAPSVACPKCGEDHGSLRATVACIYADLMTPEEIEVWMDRSMDRLGGATHEEAVRAHPAPAGSLLPNEDDL